MFPSNRFMVKMVMANTYYVASCSGGKDSVAMVLRLINEKRPLTHVVFYDAGMEFCAIYSVIEVVRRICEEHGVSFVYLKADSDFLMEMLVRPIASRKGGEHYGYDWCGGCCRWRTGDKVRSIEKFLLTLSDGEITQYIGIAKDEPQRIRNEKGKIYPLVEWGMTEADCLTYCRKNGIKWLEGDIDLYDILKRVSCWCCCNKKLNRTSSVLSLLTQILGLFERFTISH